MTHIIDMGFRAFNPLKNPQEECPYAHMHRYRAPWLDGWTQAAMQQLKDLRKVLAHYNLLVEEQ